MADETQNAGTQDSPDAPSGEQKTKKVNKLTAAEIDKKIEALESGMHIKSVYYKHMLQRKREMEALNARQ